MDIEIYRKHSQHQFLNYCQAQLNLQNQLQLELSIALISSDTPSHPTEKVMNSNFHYKCRCNFNYALAKPSSNLSLAQLSYILSVYTSLFCQKFTIDLGHVYGSNRKNIHPCWQHMQPATHATGNICNWKYVQLAT